MSAGLSLPMLIVCLVAVQNCATIGYDSSMMSSLNILESFQIKFGLDTNLQGLLTAIQNLGAIIFCFFTPVIIDRFGRKGGIFVSSCGVLVACIILSTATTKAQFFVGRIVVGMAKAVDIASVPTYLVELAPPDRRGFVAGLYWACWLLGAIVASAVGYGARGISGDWSWRLICVCMAGPALSCILSLPFIPESPRWLIAKARDSEALAVLAKFHGGGDESDPLVAAEFREIKETLAYEQSAQFETYRAWWKAFSAEKSNYKRGYILITLAMFEQTMGSSIITYYLDSVLDLAGITSESQQFAINLGQNCVAFVASLLGICLLDKVGRVKMLVVGSAFCAAIIATMAGLTAAQTDNKNGRNGIIAMVFLFQMAYSSTWTPISFSYCAEILNFTIRVKGMAFFTIVDNSVGFFSQYVIPIGLNSLGWRFYIIGVVWNTFAAIVIAFTYVETAGLTLEQIDQRFRGVPRNEVVSIIEAYEGTNPISAAELRNRAQKGSSTLEVSRIDGTA